MRHLISNTVLKLALLVFAVSLSTGAGAQQKSEAAPGALDKTSSPEPEGAMKQHEKRTRELRNATPERGESPNAQEDKRDK